MEKDNSNIEHLKILNQGVSIWNKWRIENPSILPNLRSINIENLNLKGINFSSTNLSLAKLSNIYLSEANLNSATLYGTQIVNSDLSEINLKYTDINECNFYKTSFSGATFKALNIEDSRFIEASLTYATLSGVTFTNVNLNNVYFMNSRILNSVFENVEMKFANLEDTFLISSILTNSNFEGCSLKGTKLTDTDLNRSSLKGVSLINSEISFTRMYGVDFESAKIEKSTFTNTVFGNAKFYKTIFSRITLNNIDLTSAIDLNYIIAKSPCILDLETLRRSKNLPELFLFKFNLIDLYKSIHSSEKQYGNKVESEEQYLLTHSKEDKSLAEKLYKDLINEGFRVWYNEDRIFNLTSSNKIEKEIKSNITKEIEILSEHSIFHSEYISKKRFIGIIIDDYIYKSKERKLEEITKLKKKLADNDDDEIDMEIFWKLLSLESPEENTFDEPFESLKEKVICDFKNWEDREQYKVSFNNLVTKLKLDE